VTEQQRIQDKKWSRIVAKAWADDTFRDRLLSDPKAALLEQGFETSRDVCVSVAETCEMQSTDEILYLVLPPRPDISEEELLPVGVAYCFSGGCHRCGRCGCGCGRCGGCGACGLCRAI
jgi:Nitrile hydratase, alpha chain